MRSPRVTACLPNTTLRVAGCCPPLCNRGISQDTLHVRRKMWLSTGEATRILGLHAGQPADQDTLHGMRQRSALNQAGAVAAGAAAGAAAAAAVVLPVTACSSASSPLQALTPSDDMDACK